jgi:hypothetical protein
MDSQLHAQVKPRLKRRKNHNVELDHPSNATLIHLDIENLRPHFHLPLGQAAKKIGVCKTALKKACRKIGIVGWPFRKLRAVERRIAALASKGQNEGGLKGVSGSRIIKNNEDEVEKLLELKRQLLDGKDSGKGISSVGSDEEEWTDLEMSMDIGEKPKESADFSNDTMLDSSYGSSVPHAFVLPLSSDRSTVKSIFPESEGCCSWATTCTGSCSYAARVEDHGNDALNDILKSGGNPFASEFLSLSDSSSSLANSGLSCSLCSGQSSSLCSGHCSSGVSSWSQPFSQPFPESAASTSTTHNRTCASIDSTHMPFDFCADREGEAHDSSWTVQDELKSLQSLVRVLLKEQEELTTELKLSQVPSPLPLSLNLPQPRSSIDATLLILAL